MILSLLIHHLALIEDLQIPFEPGMHVLSGETGAGKSIVVDAVNLVLGGRADRELIRTGTDRAWVEAVFDTSACPAAEKLLAEHGIEVEDHTVTLYREMTAAGRSLCRICGMVMPVTFLREVSALLMDVHGQHEHRFLMEPSYHLAFLDASGGQAHQALLAGVRTACADFLAAHRAYAKLVRENNQKHARVAWLEDALKELNKARLRPGE